MDFQSLGLAISRTENFAARPSVLIQILRLYEDPLVSSRLLEQVIQQDPALTAKVLRVATSAAYGGKPINSVSRALSIMGMNALRSIAISLAYQEILNRRNVGAGYDRAVFGRHCLAVAHASREIARVLIPQCAEELYTAGLLHEMGILSLDRFVAAKMNLAIKRAEVNQRTIYDMEREIFGYDHCDVGGLVAEKWKLSPLMINAIKYHGNPDGEHPKSLTTAIVIGANYLAYQCGFPAMSKIPPHADSELLFNELGLTHAQAQEIEAKLVAEVALVEKSYTDQPPTGVVRAA